MALYSHQDYILWNRLGATLANGGQPEEAISAYRTALNLRPNFTRSLYNLGVSCLNINCFQEAAEHLLAALELQGNSGKGEDADSLWHTLRRAFLCMVRTCLSILTSAEANAVLGCLQERHDLAEKAKPGADLNSFRGEFEF